MVSRRSFLQNTVIGFTGISPLQSHPSLGLEICHGKNLCCQIEKSDIIISTEEKEGVDSKYLIIRPGDALCAEFCYTGMECPFFLKCESGKNFLCFLGPQKSVGLQYTFFSLYYNEKNSIQMDFGGILNAKTQDSHFQNCLPQNHQVENFFPPDKNTSLKNQSDLLLFIRKDDGSKAHILAWKSNTRTFSLIPIFNWKNIYSSFFNLGKSIFLREGQTFLSYDYERGIAFSTFFFDENENICFLKEICCIPHEGLLEQTWELHLPDPRGESSFENTMDIVYSSIDFGDNKSGLIIKNYRNELACVAFNFDENSKIYTPKVIAPHFRLPSPKSVHVCTFRTRENRPQGPSQLMLWSDPQEDYFFLAWDQHNPEHPFFQKIPFNFLEMLKIKLDGTRDLEEKKAWETLGKFFLGFPRCRDEKEILILETLPNLENVLPFANYLFRIESRKQDTGLKEHSLFSLQLCGQKKSITIKFEKYATLKLDESPQQRLSYGMNPPSHDDGSSEDGSFGSSIEVVDAAITLHLRMTGACFLAYHNNVPILGTTAEYLQVQLSPEIQFDADHSMKRVRHHIAEDYDGNLSEWTNNQVHDFLKPESYPTYRIRNPRIEDDPSCRPAILVVDEGKTFTRGTLTHLSRKIWRIASVLPLESTFSIFAKRRFPTEITHHVMSYLASSFLEHFAANKNQVIIIKQGYTLDYTQSREELIKLFSDHSAEFLPFFIQMAALKINDANKQSLSETVMTQTLKTIDMIYGSCNVEGSYLAWKALVRNMPREAAENLLKKMAEESHQQNFERICELRKLTQKEKDSVLNLTLEVIPRLIEHITRL